MEEEEDSLEALIAAALCKVYEETSVSATWRIACHRVPTHAFSVPCLLPCCIAWHDTQWHDMTPGTALPGMTPRHS